MSKSKRTRIEDFLLAVSQIGESEEISRVPTGLIASKLNITKGTCSSCLKNIAAQGLLEMIPYDGVQMTEEGQTRCDAYLKRLQILEWLLSSVLKLDGLQLNDDIWRLEPGLSPNLEFLLETERQERQQQHPDFQK